jgi:hypothetical protein
VISRAWSVALVGSGVGHLAFAFVLSMMPDNQVRRSGGSRRDELFTPGAIVEIQTTTVAMPTPRDRPRMPSEPATAPLDEPKSSQPSPDGSGSRSTNPTPTDESPPSESPGMLSGARDKTSGAVVTAPGRIVVDPAKLGGSREAFKGSVVDPGVGVGEVQGPAPAEKSELGFTRDNGKMIYRDPGGRFVATLRSDGRVDFKNKSGKISWTDNAIGDPDALLRMAAGEDPYARAKAELLKATFDLRLGMAITFQKKQLDKRLDRLDGELAKIWADERRDLAARKELLFQRWDECDEPDEAPADADGEAEVELPGFGKVRNSELDQARHDAATGARDQIEKFVRKHAPTGSAEAFSASELAGMNKRRVSKQKFDPYE